MTESCYNGPQWVAASAREAVMDILTLLYLNERFAQTEDWVIAEAIDKYVKFDTKLNFDTTQVKIALYQLGEEDAIVQTFDKYARRWYSLSTKISSNIFQGGWNRCPRFDHAKTQATIVQPSKDNKSAYEKEKERQNIAASKKRKKEHWVYYIQWENDPDFVKIGYSVVPRDRIQSFLTGSPRRIKLLRLESVASVDDETRRHWEFKEYRHKREWFRYEGELREYIESLSVKPSIELWNKLPAGSRDDIEIEYF